jgi:hypothetical protein
VLGDVAVTLSPHLLSDSWCCSRLLHGDYLPSLVFLLTTCALAAYCDISWDIPILVVRRPELSQLVAREQINIRKQEPNKWQVSSLARILPFREDLALQETTYNHIGRPRREVALDRTLFRLVIVTKGQGSHSWLIR